MTRQILGCRRLALSVGLSFAAAAAFAQAPGEKFRAQHAQLANQFDSAFVSQAKMFEEIAAIDESPSARDARDRFEKTLRMQASMSMAEMMAMMRTANNMHMHGPFEELESALGREMTESLQASYSSAEIEGAYRNSPLPARAVEVIRVGREFESRLYDILADNLIQDKGAALADAVQTYLARSSSVPAKPKPARLLLEHPQAQAFKEGYPKLSGILWSAQWLQLATLEAMIHEADDAHYWGSVDAVRERFRHKLAHGADMASSTPVELPMAPTIAPTLFSLSPEAAIVLDNLNMLETVLADVLAYPNLRNKAAVMSSVVDEFTANADNVDTTIDYLASALRGGIYNQGGPAIGELSESERNRSRMEMGMRHSMVMSAP